jgi:hypothetical protein
MTGLSSQELVALVQRVFQPGPDDRALAILVDLPDAVVPDRVEWRERRELALEWAAALGERRDELGMAVHLYLYRNVRRNNADLPAGAWAHRFGPLPETADALEAGRMEPFDSILAAHRILLAPTEFSATAPLKVAARRHLFRAATMPGFSAAMEPALKLDYGEINRRVDRFKELLDKARYADLEFRSADGTTDRLILDLRFRTAHASGGVFPQPGIAGNLPSGEAYIVPYEGEVSGEPSGSEGVLPVQLGDEVVRYRIRNNRAVEVLSTGPTSAREVALLAAEPAYGNLAELGLGVLDAFGVKPIGELLLDEKLGLHIAFGRSEHFGGQVGPQAFSSPEAVVHIDRVYLPSVQPKVSVVSVDLRFENAPTLPLIRNDAYCVEW